MMHSRTWGWTSEKSSTLAGTLVVSQGVGKGGECGIWGLCAGVLVIIYSSKPSCAASNYLVHG